MTHKQYYAPLLLMLTCYSMIVVRLFVLQHHAEIEHRIDTRVVMNTMGYRDSIFDRNNLPLAYTAEQLSAFIDRRNVHHTHKTESLLKQQYPLAYNTYKQDPDTNFIWVTHGITWQNLRSLRKKSPDVHGVFTPIRLYTQPHLPHITGCINNTLGGVSGIENWADEKLFEKPRSVILEPTNEAQDIFHVSTALSKATPSQPVNLSIDRIMQYRVTRFLHAYKQRVKCDNVLCLVTNPETGEVLTAAQLPTFNPHYPEQFPRHRRVNMATARTYEFGSLMSVFAGLGYLHEQFARAETELVPSTPKHEEKGSLPETTTRLDDTIAQGYKFGLCSIAKALDIKLYDHYVRLGFTSPLSIETNEQTNSFVLTPESWNNWTPYLMTFGYNQKLTPLHIAHAFNIIANNGNAVKPTLLKREATPRTQSFYPATTTLQLKKILEKCSKQAKISVPGYNVYAKSGMSTSSAQRIVQESDVHSVAGIIEEGSYKRVIVIVAQNPEINRTEMRTQTSALFSEVASDVARYEQTAKLPPFIYAPYLPRAF